MWNPIGPFAWLLLMLLLFWPSAAPAQDAGADAERKLSRLLGRAPSSAAVDENGWTDLHYAAVLNLPGLAATLLDGGTDPNVATKHDHELLSQRLQEVLLAFGRDTFGSTKRLGPTPLHLAARGGSYDVARLLIERGADVNARDLTGGGQGDWTVLHYAVWFDAIDLARLVLDHGAVVDMKDSAGRTALYYAAEKNAEAAARLLIGRGADVVAVTDDGQTPLHRAAWANATVVARLLIDEGADVHIRDSSGGWTPLHVAAERGAEGVTRLLIGRGADVSAVADDGQTPLHRAAWANATVLARLLIDEGAEVHIRDSYGWTALHMAARYNSAEVAGMLIARGVDISGRVQNGWTPLHVAAQHKAADVARLLLREGVDVNMQSTEESVAPLHIAAAHDAHEVVQLLIDEGANIWSKSERGLTPLDYAMWKESRSSAALLVDREYDGQTLLHTKASDGSYEDVKLLLDFGADVNARNSSGDTPLMLAIRSTREAALKFHLLISHGADVNARNSSEVTPLYLAIGVSDLAMMDLLISHGADVNARYDGNTALHFVMDSIAHGVFSSNKRERFWQVTRLLENGADIRATNNEGETPLTYITVDDAARLLSDRLTWKSPPVDEVRAFLEKGVDPNSQLILWKAVWYGTPEVLELLLQYSGDMETAGDGSTPLHEIANDLSYGAEIGARMYAKLAVLLVYGADVNAKDDNGDTALDIAQRKELREVEALLRNPSEAKRIVEDLKASARIRG